MKLGKKPYRHDNKTLAMGSFLSIPAIPSLFDFDKNRWPFPVHMWGNDDYGDCVIAAEANCVLRLERIETRRTPKVHDGDAINRYKSLTGCQEPDDENDTGLVILDAMRDWRNNGFKVQGSNSKSFKMFTIAAYGELDPMEHFQLRGSIYLLGGVHFGFMLPLSARGKKVWDVTEGPGTQPGSWGGHCVYAKRYDSDGIYVQTWGDEYYVTNEFIDKYSDEAWAVVDNFDRWRKTGYLDVQAMIAKLQSIGAHVGGL